MTKGMPLLCVPVNALIVKEMESGGLKDNIKPYRNEKVGMSKWSGQRDCTKSG
jgi:hypothetical protein